MVKPSFKSAFCQTEVLHVWITISVRYGHLVDYSGGKALAVDGALVLVSTVAEPRVSAGFLGFVEDVAVMALDYIFYILHEAIAYLHIGLVENLVELRPFGEMLVNQVKEFFANAGLYCLVVW